MLALLVVVDRSAPGGYCGNSAATAR